MFAKREIISGYEEKQKKPPRSPIVDIGEKNASKWNSLRRMLNFFSDSDFVEYLLLIAEKYLNNSKSIITCNDDCREEGDQGAASDGRESSEENVDVTGNQDVENGFPVECKPISDETTPEIQETVERNQFNLGIQNRPVDGKEVENSVNDVMRKIRKKKFRSTKKRKDVENKNVDTNGGVTPKLIKNDDSKEDNLVPVSGGGAKVCQYCDTDHPKGDCPLNRPTSVVNDSRIFSSETKLDNATASLPEVLELKEKDAKGTLGIFARVRISQYTQFGPLVGASIKEMEIADDSSMKHVWEVSEGSYVCTSDPEKSNWIRWLCPAPTRHDRNIVPLERDGKLYFVTTSPIDLGSEIFFWAEMNGPWASKKMEKSSCGGCNIKFEHPMYYRTHCAVFHEASLSLTVRKYHCKVCGKAVLGKQNIMKHALLFHDGKGAYQCQFCSKFFLRLNYLEMHKNYGCSANPHRARPLCDYCGRKFCQPQKLKVHIKRMHSDLADVLHEFQCRDCMKILGSRAALQRHTKEVHKRPSGVSCSKCSKTFQNKSNLKIHMLTHSGVKPFQCQEGRCSAAFTTKQCLQFHYKKVHGLTEDRFPSIVRSVEYTFESYAGVRDAGSDNKDTDDTNDSFRLQMDNEGESSAEDNRSSQLNVVDCDDDTNPLVEPTYEETSVIEYHSSTQSHIKENDLVRTKSNGNTTSSNRENTTGVIMSGQSSASLLVEAALVSAEKELCRSLPAPSPPPPPLPPNSPPPEIVVPVYGELRRATPPPTPHYVSVMYEDTRPSTPPLTSPHQVTYVSPRCEQHYLTTSLSHEFIHDEHRYHDEEIAQNLSKFKCDSARTMYHELIPRYPLTTDFYPWDVLRPGLSLQTSIDLSVSAGHLPPAVDPPSPPYPAFHVPQKSPVYNHYSNYY